jgi:hypothetical protein
MAFDLHNWKKCAELLFGVVLLAYAVWSGIETGRKNRRKGIDRGSGLSSKDNE